MKVLPVRDLTLKTAILRIVGLEAKVNGEALAEKTRWGRAMWDGLCKGEVQME